MENKLRKWPTSQLEITKRVSFGVYFQPLLVTDSCYHNHQSIKNIFVVVFAVELCLYSTRKTV